MTKPWHSDTHLDESRANQILQSNHPDLAIKAVKKIDQGWDNDIFLVNDQLIARFARREKAIPFIESEIRTLPLLKDAFSFPIPAISHHGVFDNIYPYCVYPVIPGTLAADNHLTHQERTALAPVISTILNEIHDLEIEGPVEQSLSPDTIGRLDIAKRMDQIRQKLDLTNQLFDDPSITNSLRDMVEELSSLLDPEEKDRFSCLVHGDLHGRNILMQDRRHISGIIDWGDLHKGHPAKDFSFAVSFFGPAAFHQVANRYRFFDMSLFYLSVMSALNMTCHLTEYGLDIDSSSLLEECSISFLNIRDNFRASR